MPFRKNAYVDRERRIIEQKYEFATRLAVEENVPMDDIMKYAEHQAYNTTPDYDDEAVIQAVEQPLPIIPPIRPQLQNQRFVNPNLLRNPFIEVQHQQMLMNQQMQMLQHQQMLQQQFMNYQQFLQWQQMMMQNGFPFPPPM